LFEKDFKIISTFHIPCATCILNEFCNLSYEILQQKYFWNFSHIINLKIFSWYATSRDGMEFIFIVNEKLQDRIKDAA